MSSRYAYDNNLHAYIDLDRDEELPHITGLLKTSGVKDEEESFYTPECRERGSAVHRLTADYDLGSFTKDDIPGLVSPYKPWLAAHVRLCDLLGPKWELVEVALIHPYWRFGGRPDRAGYFDGVLTICEIKSGPKAKWHGVQLALQAILVGHELGITPEHIQRWGWYLTKTGKGKREPFTEMGDFNTAYRILSENCEREAA